MPRQSEAKVRCPYCPSVFVVSRLHAHVSAFHWGKEQREGRALEPKPKVKPQKDIPGQLPLFPGEP